MALSLAASLSALGQPTVFTYQGHLSDGARPGNGLYDFQFRLSDATSDGNYVGPTLTNALVPVSNGLFSVQLDFGAAPFDGTPRWLELGVRTNGGNVFMTLSPRQPLGATPYAIYSGNAASAASLSGTLSASQLTGVLSSGQLPAYVLTNGANGVSLNGTFTAAGDFTGNAAGLTNYIGDPDAAAYTVSHGISDLVNVRALVGFVTELKHGGIWPNLVDAVLLKTNLGASAASVVSFFNRTNVVSGLRFDSFGAVFDGSTTGVALTNLPDCRTNTLVVVEREPAVSQYSNLGHRTMAGLWNTSAWGERIASGVSFMPSYTTNGISSGENFSYCLNWPGPGGYGHGYGQFNPNDGFRHVVAISSAGNFITAWGDGWSEFNNTFYGDYAITQPLTNLFIGAQPTLGGGLTSYHTGEISAVLVFNQVLSGSQMGAVEKALRWLEPGNENVIVIGDSTAAPAAPLVNMTSETPFAGFPAWLYQMGRWQSNVNFHVLSTSGLNADGWYEGSAPLHYLTAYTTNELVNHGLGGPVTHLSVILDLGINDRGVQQDSLATSEHALSNLCMTCKAAGAELWVFTTPYCANNGVMWWGADQETIRQQENQWLRANPQLYDHLVDRDLFFSINEANHADGIIFATGYLAGVHLAAGGNYRLASAIMGQMNGAPLYNPTYATDGTVVGLTGGTLTIVTNSPALWPASPPMPGAVALVSSNGFPYMLMSTNGTGGVSATWTGTNRLGW